jgi:hypothetical protein
MIAIKKAKEPFLEADDRRKFLNKWKEDNAKVISEALGIDGGLMENIFSYRYFSGSIDEQTFSSPHPRSHTSRWSSYVIQKVHDVLGVRKYSKWKHD